MKAGKFAQVLIVHVTTCVAQLKIQGVYFNILKRMLPTALLAGLWIGKEKVRTSNVIWDSL